MPSPIPVSRLLPREFCPSPNLGPYSSPIHRHGKEADIIFSMQYPKSRIELRLSWCVINWEHLKLLQLLGSGGFGSVYKGAYYGKTVAVKMVKKSTKNKLASRQSFWSELNAAHLNHENIVKFFAATTCIPESFENQDKLGIIIMEYTGTTTLQHVIYNSTDALGMDTCFKHSLDIVNGLAFLHSNNIAHLDLKPANVLVTEDGVCKIGDFGCSQKLVKYKDLLSTDPRICHVGGTYTHRAPELLKGEIATLKADIYSFGITLWQLLTRDQPYTGDRQHVLYVVVAYNLRPVVTKNVFNETVLGQTCKSVLDGCWNADPLERPSAKHLLDKIGMMQDMYNRL
ncbi:proto-oncogene serine/threonine-protein kinase mos [Huso huso]|uniref:non-specific serine/threonine protein kinase n=1 Tax=Huso huso TaxID=61971 RepID=A0ABR1A1V7_HUSHU